MGDPLCETCMNLYYDEEYEEWACAVSDNMDEDDLAALLLGGRERPCPYYRPGDEYTIVRKQN